MKQKGIMRWIVLLLLSLFLTDAIACTNNNTNSSNSNTIIGGDTNCQHNWTDWTQDQEATCKTTGLKSRSCTLCEAKEEKVIEKTAHKYNSENVCEYCESELAYTAGLAYEKAFPYSDYYVVGIGTATETDIVIPAYHAGTRVSAIAERAFYGNDQITSVIAPSIEEIEQEAFYYCAKLHSIELNSIKKIGAQSFKDCKKLKTITLSNSQIEIQENAFIGTEYFNNNKNWENKALYIGKHLISVKEDYNEKNFTIKSDTLSVANRAFENVSAIETFNFPENEILIGSWAFTGCSNWKEFEIPDTMRLLDFALSGTSLTKLVAPAKYVLASIIKTYSSLLHSYNFVDIEIPTTLRTLIVTGSSSVNATLTFSHFTQLEHLEHNFNHEGNVNSLNLFNAYSGLKNLKSLKMPGGILSQSSRGEYGQHIGACFSSTYYEGSVAVSTYINDESKTYYFPASLKEITIDGGYVPERMFYGCDNFQSITIKNLWKYDKGNMGDDALCNVTCENLTIDNSISKLSNIYVYKDYEILNGVKNFYYLGTLQEWCSIKRDDFLYIDNIYINGQKMEGTLTLPEGMTEIPERAFAGFKGLTQIEIPDSVKQIGVDAFKGTAFYQNEENWENGVLYCGKHLIKSKEDNCGNTNIKEGTLVVADEAFTESKNLPNEILLPNSLVAIGNRAFLGTGLIKLTIGEKVEYIGEYAFSCQQLTELKYNAINAKTNIIVGSNDSLYGTPFGANVVKLTIGNKVKNLPRGVFYLMDFKEIVIEEASACESIDDYAFWGCRSLTSVTIPDSVTSIGDYAFYGCRSLTSVTIPDRVTSIGYKAFCGCSGLTNVTIGDSVTSIGDYAFYGCSGLTNVTIGDNVTSIGYDAFYGCDRLVEIINKSSHITIEKGTTNNGCVGKNALDIYNGTDMFVSKLSNDNGYIIYCDETEKILVGYTGTETELILPSHITKIYQGAFKDCSSLTSVTIPDSVISIGASAFGGCDNLTSVYISNIEAWCNISFSNVSANPLDSAENLYLNNELITEIEIPDTITEIKACAFYGCDSLTSITIPDSVISIGANAFGGCDNLTSVYISSIEAWCNISFSNASANPLYSARNLYLNNELLTELEIPNTITEIKAYAFYRCDSLTSVTIPDSVISIGASAFYGCDSLTIFCEAAKKPFGWQNSWNSSDRPVVWGYKK